MPVAIVTGASQGLGRALATALSRRGWDLVVDARHPAPLRTVKQELEATGGRVHALPGDVADASHRLALIDSATELGGLDLLVNNASTIGPVPMPELATYPPEALRHVYDVNVVAPIVLSGLALPKLAAGRGCIVNVTSDAAVEPYEGWGGYGSSKAALEQATRILAAEHPALRVLLVDPGDMRTQMHQDAFTGEDISDRPEPKTVVPQLVDLIEGDLPSGRYRLADLAGLAARPDAEVSA
jgi:NAD(P)-dependent dehydrogenase (short-subunit alcohol dehydrogenase family)